MATGTTTPTTPSPSLPPSSIASASSRRSEGLTLGQVMKEVLAPLASLKLTVALLGLAALVTFIATLGQARRDVSEVKQEHFYQVFVEVPFQTFLVPKWFPDLQDVPGSFYIPSGITILVLMLINLIAAHWLRFRLQAKGGRLLVGLGVALVAGGVTWAIMFNAPSRGGLQTEPPIPWYTMWIVMQIVLLAIACIAAFAFFTIDRRRVVERWLVGLIALGCGGVMGVVLFLGADAFIGDSAMRILWQLVQATAAAGVALTAAVLLFKRKAGMVVLHLGILGLLVNEIYVTTTNQETRMSLFEGETVSHAIDIGAVELAVCDTSDPKVDKIVVVPAEMLKTGKTISDPSLPFDVTCVEFYKNSKLDIRPEGSPSPATSGVGLRAVAVEQPPVNGVDRNQSVNMASAYVRLNKKGTEETLGTYLVSQDLALRHADRVVVDGKPYRIVLRFRHDYKPYSVRLKDVRAEFYPGTTTPRSYESIIVLNDWKHDLATEQRIWMNNPLRYGGETFYQSSYGRDPGRGEQTVLQVVKNRGWMIPYVCCMFTVVGLVWQFGHTLLKFLEKKETFQTKQQTSDAQVLGREVGSSRNTRSVRRWLPVFLLVGTLGLFVAGEFYKAVAVPVEHEGMRLDWLEQIPVMHGGRVKPLGSFARNKARQLSKRELVVDGQHKKQPAIKWLADTMFKAPGYEDYRVFKIEDPNVLSAMGLPMPNSSPEVGNNHYRYSVKELEKSLPQLSKYRPTGPPKGWSRFQHRIDDLARKLSLWTGASEALGRGRPIPPRLADGIGIASTMVDKSWVPLVAPSQKSTDDWQTLAALQSQQWVNRLADQVGGAKTIGELVDRLFDQEIIPLLRPQMIRDRIINDPELSKLLKENGGEWKIEALTDPGDEKRLPDDVLQAIQVYEAEVDAFLKNKRMPVRTELVTRLRAANGGRNELGEVPTDAVPLLQLGAAYRDGDAATFNQILKDYLESIRSNPPAGVKPYRLTWETFHNRFAPFYLAMVMYLMAALVGIMGWVVWRRPLARAAFGLLVLGFGVHLIGLIDRVGISGRAPITNLYSSVLAISMAYVGAMLLVERMTKLGVANVLAGIGAFSALLWAWTMSIPDGDTLNVLVAVLDTQFWLTTHVLCISAGYAATLVAGALGIAYVLMGLLAPSFNTAARRDFARLIYGVICFALLASFFGTVLGGLWADDSWGRFWGWDPKENGALMIVLWNALVLHARWGGLVRERGLAALAIFGNVITLWSWNGVNALGVGLHAYANTQGNVILAILVVVGLNLLVFALALIPTRYWVCNAEDGAKVG